MNIEEYRAMVAEEAKQAEQVVETEGATPNVQVDENTATLSEQAIQTPSEASHTPEHAPVEAEAPTIPQAVEVNGVEVPIDELRQGYLRQSDYTKKTQELARIKSDMDVAKKYFDAIQTDPEFAEGIARRFDLPFMTQEQAKLQELENNYHALLLEREVENLQLKYPDVNVQEVVQLAYDKKLPNLEDAYLLTKAKSETTKPQPTLDIEALKEQIRQELKAELQSNVDTSTIIGTGGGVQQVKSNVPTLSPQEMRVAQMMGLSATDYAKWRDAK